MPDVLGIPDEPPVFTSDYLGQPTPRAFKSQSALPAGGPITGGTAPATVSGSGVAPAPVGMSAGGGGGPSSPQQRASEALRALGLSADALKFVDQSRALFGTGGPPSVGVNPQVSAGERAITEGTAFPGETMGVLSPEAPPPPTVGTEG